MPNSATNEITMEIQSHTVKPSPPVGHCNLVTLLEEAVNKKMSYSAFAQAKR